MDNLEIKQRDSLEAGMRLLGRIASALFIATLVALLGSVALGFFLLISNVIGLLKLK
jgi:hypothetical protein